jgi:hypothetical protein
MHSVPAKFIEAVEVHEKLPYGATVREGAVKIFALAEHPSGAMRAHASSYATEGDKRRFHKVLGLGGPMMALCQKLDRRGA